MREIRYGELSADDALAIAKQAYVFGLPPVHIGIQTDVLSNVTRPHGNQAPRGQFVHHRHTPDPSSRELVGFNLDTLYSTAVLDLSNEPFVLSVPAMRDRYWIVQLLDAWNEVTAVLGARTFGGEGGHFAIVGPTWRGTLPDDLTAIRAATSMLIVAPRIYTAGKDDLATVHALQDQLQLTPLSRWGTSYQPPEDVPVARKWGADVDDSTPVSRQVFDLSAQDYFTRLCGLLVDNPPHDVDVPLLARMAMLGIAPGATFSMAMFPAEIRDAINRGVQAGQKEIVATRNELGKQRNGWHVTRDIGRYGDRYAYRAAWTFYAAGGSLVQDAFQATTLVDCQGRKLDGQTAYVLRFSAGEHPPVHAFWSVTLYQPNFYLARNAIDRYALGSNDGLQIDRDGTLTIYIQRESPGRERESNWLPSPAGDFLLAMRLYWPKDVVGDGSWNPPAVMRAP